MTDEKETSPLNPKLSRAIDELLDEVVVGKKKNGRPKAGEEKQEYTLEQKLRVLTLALNLEKIRLKVEQSDEGSGFDE